MCSDTIKGLMGLGIEESSAHSISNQLLNNNRAEVTVLKSALRSDVLQGTQFLNYSVTIDGEPNQDGYINLIIERKTS